MKRKIINFLTIIFFLIISHLTANNIQAAAPTFVSAGSVDSDTAQSCATTPSPPTHQANDIIIVAAYNANGDAMSTVTSGWNSFNNIAGTDDIAFFWKRATGAGTAGPAITAAGTDCFSIAYIIRGTITSGTPFEYATNSGDGTTQDNTPDTATITTTGTNRLAMAFVAHDGESAGVTWSSGNPPSGWTADSNVDSSSGTDVGFYVISKTQASAGDVTSVVVGTWSAATLYGAVTLAFIPDPTAFDQNAFRIRSSDTVALSANNDADWAAVLNTNASVYPDTDFRIRFEIEVSGGAPSQAFELWYARNGGSYAIVPNNSTAWSVGSTGCQQTIQALPSAQYTDLEATTNLLSASGSTFIAGTGNEDNAAPAVIFTDPSHTELEFTVMMRKLYDSQGHNPDGTYFDFKIYKSGGTVLDSYTNIPRVTVANRVGHIGGTPQESVMRYHLKDSNGNLYYLGEYADTSNTAVMMKSTDGGDSWNPQDTADAPTLGDLEGGDMVLSGNTIYISNQGMSSQNVEYCEYDVSTAGTPDQWTVTNRTVESITSTTLEQGTCIVKRSSSKVIVYKQEDGSFDNLYYEINSDGDTTWDETKTEIDTTASVNFYGPGCILDSTGKTHIVYLGYEGGTYKIYFKTLTSGDVLNGRNTIVDTGLTTEAPAHNYNITPPIVWTDGATERVGVAYRKSDDNMYFRSWNASTEAFENEQQISDVNVEFQEGGNQMLLADVRPDDDTDNLHAIYVERTVYDIWSDVRVSGSWGTDTERKDAVTAHWLRSSLFTHSAGNGGAKVVGYIWDNGSGGAVGYTRYDEYGLNTAPSAPTTMYTNETDTGAQSGAANPVGVGDSTPVFSAVYADSDSGDIANKYEIIVYSNSGCTTQVWDSGASGTSMTNCTQGNRCQNIDFGGTALEFDGTQYWWKIRYWDDDNTAGTFSGCSDNFTMLSPSEQLRHGNYFFNLSTERKYTW